MQFNTQSTHSITIPGKLELPLDMHGVISHLHTCRLTLEEIERYQSGLLQAVELTEDIPWEPDYMKLAANGGCGLCCMLSDGALGNSSSLDG